MCVNLLWSLDESVITSRCLLSTAAAVHQWFRHGCVFVVSGLCWFCSAGLQSVLPAVSEWRTTVPDVPALSSIYSFMSPRSQSAEGTVEELRAVQPYKEPLYSRPPSTETPSAKEVPTPPCHCFISLVNDCSCLGDVQFCHPRIHFPHCFISFVSFFESIILSLFIPHAVFSSSCLNERFVASQEASAAASADEATRLVHLEQSLTALWDRVEGGGRQAEQRHVEVLRLYADLQKQQVSAHSSREEARLSELLQQQLEQLQARLDEERQQREQVRDIQTKDLNMTYGNTDYMKA